MGRVLAVVGVLLGVLLGGAYLVPRLVDWSQQRQALAARLSAAAGRDVAVTGDIAVRLLPRPYLAVRGLEIAAESGERPLLAAETAEMRLAPGALLSGEIAVESLTVYDAELALSRQRLAALGRLARGLAGATGGTTLELAESRVTYRDPWLPTLRFEQVGATASLPAGGPAELDGSAVLAGQELQLTASLAAAQGDGPRGVTAELALPGGGAAARFRGELGSGGQVSGQTTLTADKLGRTLARWPASAGAALPVTYQSARLTAQTRWTGSSLTLAELQAELGPASARGKAVLRPPGGAQPPRLVLELAAQRLNLDDLAAGAEAPDGAAALPQAGALPSRVAGLLPPPTWTGRLDLQVGTAIWRERVLRKLRLTAPYAGGTLRLATARATLPGATTLSLAGKATAAAARDGDRPHAKLTVEGASDNLRGLLRWTGLPVPRQAGPAMLRQADLKARLNGWPPRVAIPAVTGALDGTQLEAAALLETGGERPALGLSLQAPALPLESYLGERPGRLLPPVAQRLDATVEAELGRVGIAGRRLREVSLAAQLDDGDLLLEKLAFTGPDGLAIRASGEIAQLAGPARRDLRISAEGDAVAARLARLSGSPDLSAVLPGPGNVTARWQDTGAGARLQLSGNWAGGAALDFRGRVTGGSRAQPELAGMLRFRHPRGGAWLRQRAPASLGWLALGSGPLGLTGAYRGTPQHGTWQLDGVRLGPAQGTGRLSWTVGGDRPELSLDLDLAQLPLDALLAAGVPPGPVPPPKRLTTGPAWSTAPFDPSGLTALAGELRLTAAQASYRGWPLQGLSLAAGLRAGRLTVHAAKATTGGGRISLAGWIGAGTAGDGRPGFDLTLTATNVDLPSPLRAGPGYGLRRGTLDGELALAGRGSHPAALARNSQGRITLTARDATVAGLDLAGLTRRLAAAAGQPPETLTRRIAGHLTLPRGTTRARQLSLQGRIAAGGERALKLRLAGPAGRLNLAGRFDPWAWTLRADGELALAGELPAVALTLQGPPARPRVTARAEPLAAALRQQVAPRPVAAAPAPRSPAALVPLPRPVPAAIPNDPDRLAQPATEETGQAGGNALQRLLDQLGGN